MTLSLLDLQAMAIRFRDERDWKQFHKMKDLVLGLGIEVGELGELVLWQEDQQTAEKLQDPAFCERVAEELADIQIFLLYLSEATGTDLAQAVQDKVTKNAAKYPIEKAYGSAAKYTEFEA